MAVALSKAEKRAQRIGKLIAAAVKVLLVLLFLGAVILLVPGAISSAKPPLLHLVVLTLVAAVPNVLEIIDRIAPNAATRRYERPFRWIATVVGVGVKQRAFRRIFALQGTEEVAARTLPEEDAGHYTVARQRRRQRVARLCSTVLLAVLATALTLYLWPAGQDELRLKVLQSFQLGNTFKVTVQGPPTCTRIEGGQTTCDVVLTFDNITHEDQSIGEGSFGSIGPERSVYYRREGFYQEYAIAAVSTGDFFKLSRASFGRNYLQAGETTRATFTFSVRNGVDTLDELTLEAYGIRGRIHISF
jgi:hypothetical protein